MRYAIGIDGGGTKTHLIAADREGNVLGEYFGESSSLTSCGSEQVRKNLKSLLDGFFRESGLRPGDCAALCLGTAGAGREPARIELEGILTDLLGEGDYLVTDDAEGAFAGGSETGVGVLLVAGTGSICYARSETGQSRRVGGWGHIAGDEGSGYSMGVRVLKEIFRAHDGRGKPTLLTAPVLERWGAGDMDVLVDRLYCSGKGKKEIAALAEICETAYQQGDETAGKIVKQCAEELAELVCSTADLFGNAPGSVPCVYTGSLLEHFDAVRESLQSCLKESGPMFRLVPCAHNAAWGCARLAWERAEQREKWK